LRQQLKRLENRTHWDDGRLTMKSQLIAIVAALLVVGTAFTDPINTAAEEGNTEAVKEYLTIGTNINVRDVYEN